MTLNGVIAFLRFSPNSISLLANYVTLVKEKMSVNIVFQFKSSTFAWPKLTHSAARSLCDSEATCFSLVVCIKEDSCRTLLLQLLQRTVKAGRLGSFMLRCLLGNPLV